MTGKLMWNDIRRNKYISAAVCFFMAVSAMLFGAAVLLFTGLSGSVNSLMEKAETPDFLQMHGGEADEAEIRLFAEKNDNIEEWQICRFLNMENGILELGGHSLEDSTQDNGLCVQNEKFDYLLTMDNELPKAAEGEVYVPVCYMQEYRLQENDQMQIGGETFVIAGFIRDSQMNSMMASSKRFLVNEADYKRLQAAGSEEALIEFRLKDRNDISRFAEEYAKAGLPSNGPAITYPLIRMMNTLSDGLMIFVILLSAAVILLVSMLCIRFILLAGLEKDRREIGMLKAVGIPRKKIRMLYCAKFIGLSGAGALLGLLAAYFLRKPMAEQMQELYGAAEGSTSVFVISVVCVMAVEGMILLSVWHLLKRTERLSAVEALYGRQEERKKSFMKQYILIGAVTAVCVFLMLMPQNLSSTISSPKFVNHMGIGDGQIRLDVRQAENIVEHTARIEEMLKEDPQVERFTILQTRSFETVSEDGTTGRLTVEFGDHTVFPVQYVSGHAPEGEDEIALSMLNMEESGLKVGDTVSVVCGRLSNASNVGTENSSTAGSDSRMRKDYVICGAYSDITNGGKTAKASALADREEAPVMWSIIYVSLCEGVSEEAWIAECQKKCSEGGVSASSGVKVISIAEYVEGTYGQIMRQVGLASKAVIVIASMILWVVIYLFMQLLAEQQRSEISLQKALGFTNVEIQKKYLKRSLAAILAGIVTGIILGNPAGSLIAEMILCQMGASGFSFIVDVKTVFLGIPLLVVMVALAAVRMGLGKVKNIKAYECCMGERQG